jgi:hypothetical protein
VLLLEPITPLLLELVVLLKLLLEVLMEVIQFFLP